MGCIANEYMTFTPRCMHDGYLQSVYIFVSASTCKISDIRAMIQLLQLQANYT